MHGRVVDTTRLVEEFGFTPRSTAAAFDDFLARQDGGVLSADRLAAAEQAILDAIRQVRAVAGAVVSDHGGRPDRSRRPEPPAGSDGPGDVWDRRVAAGLAFLRRRLTGQYEVDEFGFDVELTEHVFQPLLRLLYREWFRAEVFGVDHLPRRAPAWWWRTTPAPSRWTRSSSPPFCVITTRNDATCGCSGPTGVPAAGARRARPEVRGHARLSARRGTADARG